MVNDDGATCSEHRDAEAGWRCSDCGKYLCGECTAQLVKLYYCAHCEALARQLTEPRDEKPLLTWVIDAIVYPASTFVVTCLIVAPIVLLSLVRDELFGARAAQAVILALAGLLTVVRGARRNADGRAKMLGKSVAATALLWVPVSLYLFFGERGINDSLGMLAGGLAAVYVPAVIAASATDAPLVHEVNPFAVFDSLWHVKLRYAVFVFWTFVFAGVAFKLSQTTLHVSNEALVNDIATTALAVMFLLMACRMLGTFAHVHGYAFGWGPHELYVDPLVPGLKATAARKGKWGDDSSDGEGSTERSEADAEQAAARAIKRSLAKDDVAGALALYQQREAWSEDTFNPKALLDLGVAAIKAKHDELAIALFEQTSQIAGPFAPRAMFRLARLYESRDQPERALPLYRQIADEHSTSDVARPAQARLAELDDA